MAIHEVGDEFEAWLKINEPTRLVKMARLFHGGGSTKQFGSTCESQYPFYNHVGSLESWG